MEKAIYSSLTFIPTGFLVNQLWECYSNSRITGKNIITVLVILLFMAVIGIVWAGRYYFLQYKDQKNINKKLSIKLNTVTKNRDGLIEQNKKKSNLIKTYEQNLNALKLMQALLYPKLDQTSKHDFDQQLKVLNLLKDAENKDE